MPALRVADDEDLGRIVATKKDAQKARNKKLFRLFLVKPGERRLSVDRLGVAPLSDAVSNGERIARLKQMGIVRTTGKPSRNIGFRGWAVISARTVRSVECEVEATPIVGAPEESNPYHADIVLPVRVETDNEERKHYAQYLAEAAVWRGRPSSPPGA